MSPFDSIMTSKIALTESMKYLCKLNASLLDINKIDGTDFANFLKEDLKLVEKEVLLNFFDKEKVFFVIEEKMFSHFFVGIKNNFGENLLKNAKVLEDAIAKAIYKTQKTSEYSLAYARKMDNESEEMQSLESKYKNALVDFETVFSLCENKERLNEICEQTNLNLKTLMEGLKAQFAFAKQLLSKERSTYFSKLMKYNVNLSISFLSQNKTANIA